MKLTKLQRYTAYCILLEESENPSAQDIIYNGLCWMWLRIFGEYDCYELREDLLPEYFRLFMLAGYVYDWDERRGILKQCIKETEPK